MKTLFLRLTSVKRSIFLLTIGLWMSMSVFSQTLPTATQVASEMKVGWNLGNTLEAICGENAWGNPNTTQTLINSIKAAGFNTVRLPIAWDCHSTNNIIDPIWMARVKEVVDYCINADLYVIINIHWDNGWLENNVTPEAQTSVNIKQEAYWTQIAEAFISYDQHVLFASANEPNVEDATQMAVLMTYHQTFVDAVRATGGYNSSRTLVIQGPSTDIDKTYNLMTSMPTDQIADRMMAEIHYYTPYQFTLMTEDASWGKMFYYWGEGNHSTVEPDRNPTWGEESDVDRLFDLMKTQFVDKGIPVIVGELLATKRTSPAEIDLHLASRNAFHKYIVNATTKRGMIPVYWDTGSILDNAIFDRNTGEIVDQGTLNAIMEGVEGNTPQDYTLSIDVSGSGSVTQTPTGTVFPEGTTVTLTAIADNGYQFIGWTGSLSGSTNPVTITMSSSKSITANFVDAGSIGSGTILREYWTNIMGTTVEDLTSNINYPNNPTGSEQITSLEGPVNWENDYGTRIRGYVHAPTSGSYIFWVAGDDNTDLYLSSDENPANASRIAYVDTYTDSRQWDKLTSQQSASITLTAGQKYYIEVLHKEGAGGDNVAVAWKGPGITQSVIPGTYLSPYSADPVNRAPIAAISASPISGTIPLDVSFDASSSYDPDGDELSYSWSFGDGSTGSGIAPSHTYSSVGNYTATVTVSDGLLSDQASMIINVGSERVPVTGVSVSPTTASLYLGDTKQLTATVSPADATNKTVSWSSSNLEVATVNTSGLVTALSDGFATITVRTEENDYIATCSVDVSTATIPVTGVTLFPESVMLKPEGTQQLTATVFPSNATNKTVTWSSDNMSVATVNSNGLVTALSDGFAIISVTTQENSFNANCEVTVSGSGGDCDDPITINIPFVQNGEGDFCWFTTTEIAYINNWNMEELTINGMDYTNTWSNRLPPAENGGWTIHYKGNYPWSHFEAPQAVNPTFKSADGNSSQPEDEVFIYPNPASDNIIISVKNWDDQVDMVIYDTYGRLVKGALLTNSNNDIDISDLKSGMYVIKITCLNKTITNSFIKE